MAQQAAIDELRRSSSGSVGGASASLRKSVSLQGTLLDETGEAATGGGEPMAGGGDDDAPLVPCSAKLYFYFSQQDMMPWAEAPASLIEWRAGSSPLDILGVDDSHGDWLLSFAKASERDEWLADLQSIHV
jgi:hypothetical protein